MSQGVSRRTPAIGGNEKADTTPKAATSPPVAGAPLGEFVSPAGTYHRIDHGTAPAEIRDREALVSVSTRTAPAPAEQTESLQSFVFEHAQYFDSYLATEPGRQLFWSRDRSGLISFTTRGRFVLVGGGLIAPEDQKETLLREFQEYASRRRLRVAFHNIGEGDLPLFRKVGFQITKWGEEPVVDLESCTWSGKAYEWVRRQSNFCIRHGVTAFEVRPEELEPEQWSRTYAEILEVARESLSLKPQADEMKFFEGRIDNHPLGRRRLFIARSGDGTGRMEGFVICNPMAGGRRWSTELYRHRIDSVRGTVAYLVHHLMQQMQSEGVEQVGLCLDPGLHIETPMPGDCFYIRHGLQIAEHYLGAVFDVAGLRHFKGRFRPRFEGRYVCASPAVTIGSLIAFVQVFGIFNLSFGKLARIIVDRVRKRASRKTLADAA
jgi:phosphatidylglycerol lysyltransferase